ncbi:MAG TPA: NAD(+)/NADH kinase, partial [Candidatus Eremiobacteraceae bacterium]|nr:NAD(+)/NADH kinase [Candidatus Eremiobacteraceae bacterium]
MSALKKIGIISRPRRVDVSAIVPPLVKWLEAKSLSAYYDQETATSLGNEALGKTRAELAADSDLLLVLGGDGTLLAAAREAAPRNIPILPVNLGSLGFLTSFTLQEMYPALEETLAGRLAASERAMLHAALIRDGKTLDDQLVLNEVVINKGALARMIEVKLSIDQEFV